MFRGWLRDDGEDGSSSSSSHTRSLLVMRPTRLLTTRTSRCCRTRRDKRVMLRILVHRLRRHNRRVTLKLFQCTNPSAKPAKHSVRTTDHTDTDNHITLTVEFLDRSQGISRPRWHSLNAMIRTGLSTWWMPLEYRWCFGAIWHALNSTTTATSMMIKRKTKKFHSLLTWLGSRIHTQVYERVASCRVAEQPTNKHGVYGHATETQFHQLSTDICVLLSSRQSDRHICAARVRQATVLVRRAVGQRIATGRVVGLYYVPAILRVASTEQDAWSS